MEDKSVIDLYQKYIQIGIMPPGEEDVSKLKREVKELQSRISELENIYKSIISKKEKEIQQLKETTTDVNFQREEFEEIEEIVLDENGEEIGPIREFIKQS